MIARRGFLKLMGIATASTVKLEEQYTGLSGIGDSNPMESTTPTAQYNNRGEDDPHRRAWADMIVNGYPRWKLDEIRRDAGRVHALDPDIAGMRSISLVNKVDWQRKRQIDKAIAQDRQFYLVSDERLRWLKKWGLDYM